jgi:hypothetical protein
MNTIARWVAGLLAAVVVIIAASYVAHGIVGAQAVSRARRQAAQDLDAALSAGWDSANIDRERARSAAATRWGRPRYSWQELVCTLETREAGWMVESYEQRCRIRSVDLIPVAAKSQDQCEFIPGPRPHSAFWKAIPPTTTLIRGPSEALGGNRPPEHSCPDDLLHPSTSGESRLLSGERPPTLAGSPAWIVMAEQTDVSTTDLGCSPWRIPFCNAPVDRPSLGSPSSTASPSRSH